MAGILGSLRGSHKHLTRLDLQVGSKSCYTALMMVDVSSRPAEFKEAARELEADEDEVRWEERSRKVAKPKVEMPE